MNSPFFLLFLAAGCSVCSVLRADEKKDGASEPLVKKVGASTYRIGEVTFDSKTKEVAIPVIVNLREGGPIEYVLVNESGKTHESILITAARPIEVQIALKLLKYKEGAGDIFDKLLPAEDRKVKGKKSENRGTAVDVVVEWKDKEGKEHSSSVNEWVLDGSTIRKEGDPGTPMPEHPWHYTGSVVQGGKFLGELEGSIIAVYLDPVSLFNTSVPGSEHDERWGANHRLIPAIGTKAVLKVRPVTKE